MKREDLADEIRGAGFALRYADGPVVGGSFSSKRSTAKQIERRKLKESDLVVIRRASTCFNCEGRASDIDIEFTETMASNYKDFGKLIWLCIDHDIDCDSVSDISVSEKAGRKFLESKEKWMRKIAEKAKNAKKAKKPTKKVAKKKKSANRKPRRGKD